MAIICISRELAANGEATSRALAQMAGYRFIEKEFIDAWLAEHDISAQVLKKYDEKKPSFWAAIPEKRDMFLHYLSMAILQEAVENHCIFLGRGAGAILKNMPGVISVLLTAPEEIRLERLKTSKGFDEHTAGHHLKQSDHDRKGFYRFFFNRKWQDNGNYNLIINTGALNPLQTARIIDAYRIEISSPETEMRTLSAMKHKYLQTQVIDEILYKQHIPLNQLIVEIEGHTVTLRGFADSTVVAKRAANAAQKVEGVIAVKEELSIVPQVVA